MTYMREMTNEKKHNKEPTRRFLMQKRGKRVKKKVTQTLTLESNKKYQKSA
jgi:hypothetical protein